LFVCLRLKTNDSKVPPGDTCASLITTEIDESVRPKAPGANNGGMMKLIEHYKGPIISIQVDDITAALESVEKGGKAVAKRTLMGKYGADCYFRDTEGNLMGLFEALWCNSPQRSPNL